MLRPALAGIAPSTRPSTDTTHARAHRYCAARQGSWKAAVRRCSSRTAGSTCRRPPSYGKPAPPYCGRGPRPPGTPANSSATHCARGIDGGGGVRGHSSVGGEPGCGPACGRQPVTWTAPWRLPCSVSSSPARPDPSLHPTRRTCCSVSSGSPPSTTRFMRSAEYCCLRARERGVAERDGVSPRAARSVSSAKHCCLRAGRVVACERQRQGGASGSEDRCLCSCPYASQPGSHNCDPCARQPGSRNGKPYASQRGS